MFNSLLPPNATFLERAAGRASGIAALPVPIDALWNPATCPIHSLPWLAWALSVDEWDEAWEEATQRRVIAASIEIHRRKGTVGAVRAAITMLGHSGRLVEWWQTTPPGTPHTFQAEVEIGNRGLGETAVTAIDRQIAAVKPARSHYTLRLVGRSVCAINVACAALSGEICTVQPYQLTQVEAPAMAALFGAGYHSYGSATVYPLQ